jgi:hypothetical protein
LFFYFSIFAAGQCWKIAHGAEGNRPSAGARRGAERSKPPVYNISFVHGFNDRNTHLDTLNTHLVYVKYTPSIR